MTWEEEARAMLERAMHNIYTKNEEGDAIEIYQDTKALLAKPREPEIPQDVARDAAQVCWRLVEAEQENKAIEADLMLLARSVVERMKAREDR